MKKRILLFALLSLFLIISAANAEDIAADSNTAIDVSCEEQSLDVFDSSDMAIVGSEESDDADLGACEDEDVDFQSDTSTVDSIEDSNAVLVAGSSDGSNAVLSAGSSAKSTIDSSKVPYKFTSTKNISSVYRTKANFYVKVLNKDGKAINHTLVTFKSANKTYRIYTNEKGVAKLTLNYYAGKYTIKYFAGNISGSNSYTIRNYYKIINHKWKSGANVLKNKKIKANVPNSALVKRMIKLAKSGTPVIMFKGGVGKKVFITAGCHGNELPSQVAAMKLIKYLQTHSIKGTVYVMPFMNPKGTAANVRDYKDVHLNKLANKKGTISYKTVQLIKKYKCNAYGDFHATRPGGKPGKDVAMGTYKPTKASATMARYISKNANVKCIIYNKAGAEYPGALEDEVNLKKIPAVTCEVISPHGTIRSGSVNKSLLMMKTLLKYNSLI